MSGNNLKIILSLFGIYLFSFQAAQAESVGDINYPPIGQEKMSREQMKTMHDERLRQMEEGYKTKVEALETRYQEKVKQSEERHEQMMKKRESLADFKKERMEKRKELQKEYDNKRKEFESDHEDSKNPYVIEQKERQEYFDKKNKIKRQEDGHISVKDSMPMKKMEPHKPHHIGKEKH